jgi:hypothetical protein
MNDSLEDELRRALRPVDPGDDFARKVMARVQRHGRVAPAMRARASHRVLQWLPAALAASLLVTIIVKHERIEERTAQERAIEDGLRAREQLLAALHVTSEKLDLAYQLVHDESQ